METKTLHVLIVEDSVDDAELILDALRTDYLDVDFLRVETAGAMQNAVADGIWNVVLSDYNLPGFSADEALSVLQGSGLDIPFIVVSGCIGEEVAVALVKAGAHDFVMKGSAMLVPAVQRALLEADTRRQFNLAQIALQHSEARFRAIASNLPGMVYQFTRQRDGSVLFPYVSDGSRALLNLEPQALHDNPGLLLDLILPEDKAAYEQSMAVSVVNRTTWNWEGRIKSDGAPGIKWLSLRASPRAAAQGAVTWDGIITNITRNKLAEIEIARSREQLAEFSSYLQKIKEEERAKIAREIHDDIGGTLTAIKCDILWCKSDTPRDPRYCREKAASIESLVDNVIDSTRRISMDLRPGVLDCGIVAALRWQAKEFNGRTTIPCEIFCAHEEIPLDQDLSVAVFRIFQETLTNISKHANASRIQVRLAETKGWLELNIADNGRGITDADMAKPKSFGIRGIRERCQHLGGSLQIAGTREGTRVSIRIPVNGGENRPSDHATTTEAGLTAREAERSQECGKRAMLKIAEHRGKQDDSSVDYR